MTERTLEVENGNVGDEPSSQLGSILVRRNHIFEEAKLCKFMIKIFDVISATAQTPGRKFVEAIFVFRDENGAPSISCYKRNPLQLTDPGARLPNNVPIIICNGTPTPLLLLQAFVADRSPRPKLDVISPRVLPSPDSYYARQYPDDVYSKSHWLGELGVVLDAAGKRKRKKPKDVAAVVADAERIRAMNSNGNIKIGHRFILQMAYEYEGSNRHHKCRAEDGRKIDVLVIASLAVEVMLRGLGLPANVDILHFRKTRGTDRYAEVPCIIILGRELPPLWTLEQDVAALFYDDPEVTDIKRVKFDGRSNPLTCEHIIAMADGAGRKTKCERHPDPRVEALRQVRSDHEVIQALYRARLLSRTAENPVEIYVFGQTDTGIPMHELGRWTDAKRTEAEVMMAKRLVFENADNTVRAFPFLWLNSSRSARRATSAAWELATQLMSPGWRMASFRLEKDGEPGQRQRVLLDANRYLDPGKTVAELLGGKVIDWQWCDEPATKPSPIQGNGGGGVRD